MLILLLICAHSNAQQKEAIASFSWSGSAYQIQRTDTFYYNAAGHLVGMTGFGAAHNGTVFLEMERCAYINDPQGRLLEQFVTRPMGAGYDSIQKFSYQYFPNGKIRLMEENSKDSNTGTWRISPTRTYYEYTSSGQVDSIKGYTFNAGNWGLSSVQKHHYLPNAKLSEIRIFLNTNGILSLAARSAYTYDSLFRLTLIEIFEGANEPLLRETREYFYTASGELADSLIITNLRPITPTAAKWVYQYLPNDSLVDAYRYTRHLGQWVPLQWFKTTYRQLSTQTKVLGVIGGRVYPNPASEYLYIELEEPRHVAYKLRSLNGQIVQQGGLQTDQNTLSINQLVPGMYWLEIESLGRTAVYKFMKR